jgi:hypothetical protein
MFGNMRFEIVLSGNDSSIEIAAAGGTIIREAVPVGIYRLDMNVWHSERLYARGFVERVEIIGGQTAYVTVPMEPLFGGAIIIEIEFEHINGTPALIPSEPVRLFLSGNPITLRLSNPENYTRIEWLYNDHLLNDADNPNQSSLTLYPSDIRYNMLGPKLLTVEVVRNGIPYGLTIEFEVTP